MNREFENLVNSGIYSLLLWILWFVTLYIVVTILLKHFNSKSRTHRFLFEQKISKLKLIMLVILFIALIPFGIFFWAFGMIGPVTLLALVWGNIVLTSLGVTIPSYRRRRFFGMKRRLDSQHTITNESKKLMDLIDSIDSEWVKSITFLPFWWQPFQLSTYNVIRLSLYVIKSHNKAIFGPGELEKIYEYIYENLDTTKIDLFKKADKHIRNFIKSGWSIQVDYIR